MAATIMESHENPRGFYARVQFTAQGDSVVLNLSNPRRQLAAQARVIGGTLSAFTVSVTLSLNPAVDPAEAGVTLTEAALYSLAATEKVYMSLKIATSAWTGSSTLEVVVGGTF